MHSLRFIGIKRTLRTMTTVLRIDDEEFTPPRLTGADVLAMTRAGVLPEGRGHELIEGVLVRMASQYAPHVAMLSKLVRWFNRNLPDEYEVAIGPSIFLSEFTMLEPDVCIYPAAMKSTDVRGADILLAVEVSDSSRRYDLGKKARLYAAHGVRDYWVFDLETETLHRHSEPGGEGYGRVAQSGFGEAVALPFTLQTIFALDG